ncbi:mechanosensitive ion channel family protein [Rhizobium sp. 9140]|uniref:mechanosensitive ion channel family protein n=1 Tax=Rhizobium sp. 9140 TaxID=1761900 RepID=UPI000B85FFA7|nr:mechanosensitive ion channel family protein [Rhizobium sp. 9140]
MSDMITWLDQSLRWVPAWAVSVILLALLFGVGIFVHRILFEIATRIAAKYDLFWRSLVARSERPTRLVAIMVALSFGVSIAPLTSNQADNLHHILLLGFILVFAWIAKVTLHIWTTVYLRRFKLDAEDNLLARKHVTQSRIMERIAGFVIIIFGVAACLMTFPAVQQYGVSLLASAGVAGIVLGLALQPVLKNLFAGIQLAITQPIRLDDALLIEGEWGNVEEITATYVVVKIWDWRRLVLPLSYFIEKPFQNWTRETAALIGTVMVYLDYSVPVDAIRKEAEKIAAASPLWDGQVINIAVTDLKPETVEIRILCSASNAARAFDLRCEMREKIIGFIAQTYPTALPHLRAELKTAETVGNVAVTTPWRAQV